MKSKEMKPKFKKYEIVKIKISNVDFLRDELAYVVDSVVNPHGYIIYDLVTLDNFELDVVETQLEATGKFLTQEQIKMREEFLSRKNKFEVYEIVKIRPDTGYPYLKEQTQYILDVKQSPISGVWSYLIRDMIKKRVLWLSQHNLEATGKFLSEEEINERKIAMSRKPKFECFEIVKITNPEKHPQFKNSTAYIRGESQSLIHGKWEYSVWIYEQSKAGCFKEKELESTGKFTSKEEVEKLHADRHLKRKLQNSSK